jgi:hypothetical protein
MKLESGKTYLVNCERKGTFMLRVTGQDNTWTYGVVAAGKASAMLDYNVKRAREDITCRTSFIRSAVEQPEGSQS